MPPLLSDIPPPNGGSLLLVRTMVLGYGGFNVSFRAVEDF